MTDISNIVKKSISIWLNEGSFYKSNQYDNIRLVRSDYKICDETEKYHECIVKLFEKQGFIFSTKKEGQGLGSCEINVNDALKIWFALENYIPEYDTIESCLDRLDRYKDREMEDDLVHMGDCTKTPSSCMICVEESLLSDVRSFITMLAWNGVSILRIGKDG